MVKKALKVLNKIELLVIYITFGGMIFAAFAQVIFRLILKAHWRGAKKFADIVLCGWCSLEEAGRFLEMRISELIL